MKTFFRLIILVLFVVGWALAALSLHVVRGTAVNTGKDRWLVVPKSRLHYGDTYADVRNWTPAEIGAHPSLVRRLIESGKADILASAAPQEQRAQLVVFLGDTLANPPPPPTTAPATQPQ
jgi:hypothetical protein